ncbi:MAG: glutamyl-tRNA reductase, partial [Halobacteria archaeon]|nr:glutamyl-tRNA reductase [Halobacteria archaeon]
MKNITGLLVTHNWAELDDLKDLCRPNAEEILDFLIESDGVDEALVIQTCNRAEFYASGEDAREALKDLEEFLDV